MILRRADLADSTALSALFARSYPVLLAADYAPSVLDPVLPLMCRAQPGLLDAGRFHVIAGPDGLVAAGDGATNNRAPAP
jgi:hypothetical protein